MYLLEKVSQNWIKLILIYWKYCQFLNVFLYFWPYLDLWRIGLRPKLVKIGQNVCMGIYAFTKSDSVVFKILSQFQNALVPSLGQYHIIWNFVKFCPFSFLFGLLWPWTQTFWPKLRQARWCIFKCYTVLWNHSVLENWFNASLFDF